jgi:hypothetical protein
MLLLDLPIDVLRYYIFSPKYLDFNELVICRFVCTKLSKVIKSYDFKIEVEAGKGHKNILQWAISQGCPINKNVCAFAARNGHLEILKWAVQYPWFNPTNTPARGYPSLNSSYNPSRGSYICRYAAMGGHLFILGWLTFNGCQMDDTACESAAEYGHLHILQWIEDNYLEPWHEGKKQLKRHPHRWGPAVFEAAARGGHIHILAWLRYKQCRSDETIFDEAAKMGNIGVLKWLKENKFKWTTETSCYAAREGHLEALKWLRENRCPPFNGIGSTSVICQYAVIGRHLEILKWAYSVGCELDESSYINAQSQGCQDILEWLVSHGCNGE